MAALAKNEKVMLGSIYMEVGKGMEENNRNLMCSAVVTAEELGLPLLLMGDYNADVEEVKDTGIPRQARLEEVWQKGPTCSSPSSCSNIDFGFISISMAGHIKEVGQAKEVAFRPHAVLE
eukprot:2661519-Lingulodinium_polyedra.AAC.1